MELRKIIIALLALLLAGLAMVPMVSAGEQNDNNLLISQIDPLDQPEKTIDANIALGSGSLDLIESNYVSLRIARDQALEELEEIIALKKFGDGVNWNGSNLNQKPLIVYDMNGKMLYYKFGVQSEGNIVGEINVASSKALGSPIQSVSTTSSDGVNIEKMQFRAEKIISLSFPGYEIISKKVALYDYPSTGLLFKLLNKTTSDTVTFVVDPNNYPDYRIIDSSDSLKSNGKPSYKNNSRSVYDSISPNEKKSNIVIWQKENDRINSVNEKIDSIRTIKTSASGNRENLIISALMTGKAVTGTRVLLRNGLYPTVFQGYGYEWCKIGTAHTITTYYYLIGELMDNSQSVPRSRTLQEIATKMEAQGTSAPTSPWKEQDYYRDAWSTGGLGMNQFLYQPFAPTLTYIQTQINNGDPMKIGTQVDISTPFGTVPASHARACYGYDTTGSQPLVYFSDTRLGPQGQLTYEVFSSSNYNTYIGKTSA
jgi:hypothetical protein